MESNKLVIFQVNEEEYGIPVEQVISIEKLQDITPIPEMPVYINGLMKVRNELIPVLDTNQLLFSSDIQKSDKTRLIVVQTTDLLVGFLVEDAKEILDVKLENIQPLSIIATAKSSYISGMVNLEKRLIAIIDPGKLVKSLAELDEIKEEVENQLAVKE
ncbi:chemotaxis protein CheW [Sutcliffiella deserti]|uniref:chemotaxis protein CheW n=1 Tax=Sutcliffiella deserti TaxID=2875501 RepID=UPI001CC10D8F|nr:chemotaxis protein CheW [Sutcliffiella deserti]